jgi:hypothetical protein
MPEYQVSLHCRVISDKAMGAEELAAEALKRLVELHQKEDPDEFLSRMDSEELQ